LFAECCKGVVKDEPSKSVCKNTQDSRNLIVIRHILFENDLCTSATNDIISNKCRALNVLI